MLNKLRWKFVLINMILVTLVLTIVFTAVLASSYHRLEMDGVQAMERVLREGDTAFPKREIGGKLPGGKAPPKMMTAAFYVELDGGGAVQRVVGENVTVMDNGALNAIVSAARRTRKNLRRYPWRKPALSHPGQPHRLCGPRRRDRKPDLLAKNLRARRPFWPARLFWHQPVSRAMGAASSRKIMAAAAAVRSGCLP